MVGVPAMYCLLEMVAAAHEFFASQFTKELDWIKVCISIIAVILCMMELLEAQ